MEHRHVLYLGWIIFSLFVIAITACDDDKRRNNPTSVGPNPKTDPTAVAKGNNGALLSGAVIGSGTAAVSDLRKQIAVTVLGTNPSFTVGTAYATRSRTSTDYAHIILPVTNSGTQALCFVKLAGVTYRDASGAAIGVPGLAFVSGSVGKVSSAIFTDTCLAPGETGMVADIEADLYTAVTKMEFTFEIPSFTISVPIASVIPQSYSYTDVLAINVKNVGLGPAQIASNVVGLSKLFLLDDLGQPLMWNFYSTPSVTNIPVPSVIVPVSGTATMTGSSSYDGSASKLLVFVDFEDASVTANLKRTFGIEVPASEVCAASLPEDELMLCWNEIRNQRLDSLKSFYDTHQGSTP